MFRISDPLSNALSYVTLNNSDILTRREACLADFARLRGDIAELRKFPDRVLFDLHAGVMRLMERMNYEQHMMERAVSRIALETDEGPREDQ